MSKVEKSAVVPYSAEAMYNLINDIEAYPQFLPWCSKTEILSKTEDEIQGRLHIAKGGFQKSFATKNRLVKNKEMTLELLEGPFKKMHGLWQFEQQAEDLTRVTFKMEFEFSSTIIAMTVGVFFTQIANTMLDAFCKRADEIYAKK